MLVTHQPPREERRRGDRTVVVRCSSGRVDVFPRRAAGQMGDCRREVEALVAPGDRVVEIRSDPAPTRRRRPSSRRPRPRCRRGEGRVLLTCLEHLADFALQAPACDAVLNGRAAPPPRGRTIARISV